MNKSAALTSHDLSGSSTEPGSSVDAGDRSNDAGSAPKERVQPERSSLSSPPELDERAARREVDAVLVKKAQGGDYRAFDELVTFYRGHVFAMIKQMIQNDGDAWDLSQDTFLKAWKALPKFEARAGFYTWIYRIAHNTTYDWMRKKRIDPGQEFDDIVASKIDSSAPTAPKDEPQPDEALVSRERMTRIRDAIRSLSEGHREVILLREVEGRTYEEISEIIGCTTGTVMSRLFYARKKLQGALCDLVNNE